MADGRCIWGGVTDVQLNLLAGADGKEGRLREGLVYLSKKSFFERLDRKEERQEGMEGEACYEVCKSYCVGKIATLIFPVIKLFKSVNPSKTYFSFLICTMQLTSL